MIVVKQSVLKGRESRMHQSLFCLHSKKTRLVNTPNSRSWSCCKQMSNAATSKPMEAATDISNFSPQKYLGHTSKSHCFQVQKSTRLITRHGYQLFQVLQSYRHPAKACIQQTGEDENQSYIENTWGTPSPFPSSLSKSCWSGMPI